jgi:hypothetical protein
MLSRTSRYNPWCVKFPTASWETDPGGRSACGDSEGARHEDPMPHLLNVLGRLVSTTN